MSRLLAAAAAGLLCMLAAPSAFAQGFIAPIPSIDARTPSYVILPSGERIDGTIPVATFINGTLRSVTLKTDDGRKLKFKAADVKVLGHKPGKLAKLAAMSEQIDNKWDLFTADWEGTMGREWVIFQQAMLPGKAAKYALMQLLNPGFDRRLQVYYDAKAANNDDSVMGISTAPPESYIVVKDGRQSVQVKKGNYNKLFSSLFGDCSKLMEASSEKKPKFKNFAGAAYAFDHLCGGEGGAGSAVASAPARGGSDTSGDSSGRSSSRTAERAPEKAKAPEKAAPPAGATITGSVIGYTAADERPLSGARIEVRPDAPLTGGDKSPMPDLVGLALSEADGSFVLDQLHSPTNGRSYPLLEGWTYEIRGVATWHYIFSGVVEYFGEEDPWDFALETKSADVVDDSGVIGPDDRQLQHGATRRGNR
jgi:hypothetical protein